MYGSEPLFLSDVKKPFQSVKTKQSHICGPFLFKRARNFNKSFFFAPYNLSFFVSNFEIQTPKDQLYNIKTISGRTILAIRCYLFYVLAFAKPKHKKGYPLLSRPQTAPPNQNLVYPQNLDLKALKDK